MSGNVLSGYISDICRRRWHISERGPKWGGSMRLPVFGRARLKEPPVVLDVVLADHGSTRFEFSGPDLGRLRFRLGFGVRRGSENVKTPEPSNLSRRLACFGGQTLMMES